MEKKIISTFDDVSSCKPKKVDWKMMEDLKTLFRFLLYNISLTQGQRERCDEMEKNSGTLSESYEFVPNDSFWRNRGVSIRNHIRSEVPHQELISLIPHLLEQEYHLKHEDSSYQETTIPMIRYIIRLYTGTHPYIDMLEMMNEEQQLMNRAVLARDNN
jgi:hypothetical protein